MDAQSLIEAAPVILEFTPQHALLGGSLIGIASVGKLFLTGRVMGVSGAIKGLVAGDSAAWRPAFLSGLLAGGIALSHFLPGAFENLPPTYTLARAVAGGFLVGLGSAVGNGCTSGHGICGNARLSLRSTAFTLLFMASGAAAAVLTGAANAAGIVNIAPAFKAVSAVEAKTVAVVAAASVAGLGVIGALGGRLVSRAGQLLEKVSEGASGFVFALGLGFSGMCRPSKVIGFLNVAAKAWDPSLMFVMGSAVGLSALGFAAVQRLGLIKKPVCCDAFSIPSLSAIDKKLVLGGLIFGAGWGISGICPGPGIVSSASMSPNVVAYLGALCLGMAVERVISKQVEHKEGNKVAGKSDKKK